VQRAAGHEDEQKKTHENNNDKRSCKESANAESDEQKKPDHHSQELAEDSWHGEQTHIASPGRTALHRAGAVKGTGREVEGEARQGPRGNQEALHDPSARTIHFQLLRL